MESFTQSRTVTNTRTSTQTASQTPTQNVSPTKTPTQTRTSTQTPTRTQTPTQTPTQTQTPTRTQTPTSTPAATCANPVTVTWYAYNNHSQPVNDLTWTILSNPNGMIINFTSQPASVNNGETIQLGTTYACCDASNPLSIQFDWTNPDTSSPDTVTHTFDNFCDYFVDGSTYTVVLS